VTLTDDLLTVQEAADYRGVSVSTVYQQRWLGIGPVSSKRNGRVVFRRYDIDAYHEREQARTLRGEGV
jgi:predicted site-specific integrase-resolvase